LRAHVYNGGKIFLTLAGAMSTARLGLSISELIRAGHVGAISSTGANVEEDVFRAADNGDYTPMTGWRDLRPSDEAALRYRVTDVCLPTTTMDVVAKTFAQVVREADATRRPALPPATLVAETLDALDRNGVPCKRQESWLAAAREHDVPIWTPGWEDSTLAMYLAAARLRGDNAPLGAIQNGLEQFEALAAWYAAAGRRGEKLAFLQVGGGIAGDFAVCVAPTLRATAERPEERAPHWAWFGQISDAESSFGGYSGALPREKITWDKIGADTPRFSINSDATIVLPLMIGYLLDW